MMVVVCARICLSDVGINEIQSSNSVTIKDENGDASELPTHFCMVDS